MNTMHARKCLEENKAVHHILDIYCDNKTNHHILSLILVESYERGNQQETLHQRTTTDGPWNDKCKKQHSTSNSATNLETSNLKGTWKVWRQREP